MRAMRFGRGRVCLLEEWQCEPKAKVKRVRVCRPATLVGAVMELCMSAASAAAVAAAVAVAEAVAVAIPIALGACHQSYIDASNAPLITISACNAYQRLAPVIPFRISLKMTLNTSTHLHTEKQPPNPAP